MFIINVIQEIGSRCVMNNNPFINFYPSIDLHGEDVVNSLIKVDEFINDLDGYMVYGTGVIDGNNIRDINVPERIALVIGNEGKGISDKLILIPFSFSINSNTF